jgi:hypothetical protein
MSDSNSKKEDTRPAYVSPKVIRLDDVYSGAGGSCSPTGSGVAAGTCNTGGGAGQNCGTGNGAKFPCFTGNGLQ